MTTGGADEVRSSALTSPPTVDDAGWSGVPAIRLREVGTGDPPVWSTEVRVGHTADALWLRYACTAGTMRATMTRYKDLVWREDAVEAYLSPPGDPALYELQLNPIGTARDLRVTDPGGPGQGFDDGWSCAGWVTRAVVDRGSDRQVSGWRALMGIPWRSVSTRSPHVGGWRIALFRIERDPQEFSGLRWLAQDAMELHAPGFLARLTVPS